MCDLLLIGCELGQVRAELNEYKKSGEHRQVVQRRRIASVVKEVQDAGGIEALQSRWPRGESNCVRSKYKRQGGKHTLQRPKTKCIANYTYNPRHSSRFCTRLLTTFALFLPVHVIQPDAFFCLCAPPQRGGPLAKPETQQK